MSPAAPNENGRPTLGRRNFLKIVAGVPVAIGLPLGIWLRAGAAGDGEGGGETPSGGSGGSTVGDAIAFAARNGRPALLVSVPVAEAGCSPDIVHTRRAIADNLGTLIETPEEAMQLVLGQLVIIVATKKELAAAVPLGETDDDAALYFLDDAPVAGKRVAAPLAERLHHGPGAMPALTRRLRELVFGADAKREKLAARRDREAARLDAGTKKRAAEQLAKLGSAAHPEREAASAWLGEHRGALIAHLAWEALTSDNAEVRARATLLARPTGRLEPVGTTWVVAPPVAEPEPCPPCGMVMMPERTKDYLRILSGDRTPPKPERR